MLIYKATEAVNFAQGDFMMLGAFVPLGLVNPEYAGLPFWVVLPLVFLIMGAIGYLIDATILRVVFGQSQTAVIILTIALGFVIRFIAGAIWGTSRNRCNRRWPWAICVLAVWCWRPGLAGWALSTGRFWAPS